MTQRGQPETVQLNASDADGDDLTYRIVEEPQQRNLSKVSGVGEVVYTPSANFDDKDSSCEGFGLGSGFCDSFRFKVNDRLDDSNVATVMIRTNQVPSVVKEVSDQAVYRLDPFDLDVSRVFSDADDDTLELAAEGLPASLQVSDGRVQGVPSKDEVGTYAVILTAQDGWGGSASTSFALQVTNTCPFNDYEVTFADDNLRRKVNAALNLSAGSTPTCRQMEGLTSLEASGSSTNKIASLDGLEHARNLTTLNLKDNQIEAISVLSELINLTVLSLNNNAVRDLSPLAQLTELTNLQLLNNRITSVAGIGNLTELTTLNLGENNVSDISALAGLTG